jgi:hypothetical protein
MAIVHQARQATAGQKVEPRPFKLPGEKDAKSESAAADEKLVSPGDEDATDAEEETAAEPAAEPATEATDAASEVASGG